MGKAFPGQRQTVRRVPSPGKPLFAPKAYFCGQGVVKFVATLQDEFHAGMGGVAKHS